MNISPWNHLRERQSDQLTHRQRTVRHGIVTVLALALGACLKMPLDALLGNDVKPEQSLAFVGAGVLVSVLSTAIDLFRGPRPITEPDHALTDEMRRRVR